MQYFDALSLKAEMDAINIWKALLTRNVKAAPQKNRLIAE